MNKHHDAAYLSKRQRNNIAAQRSRQKKRLLDMEKEERMKQLEVENEQLKRRVAEVLLCLLHMKLYNVFV